MSHIEFYDYFTEVSSREKAEGKLKQSLGRELHAPVNPSDFHYFEQVDEPTYDALKNSFDGNMGKDESDRTKFVDDAYSASMAGFTSWLKRQIRKVDGSRDDAIQEPNQLPPEEQKQPKTSADQEAPTEEQPAEAEAPTSSAAEPVRVGGALKKHTIIVIPADKIDTSDKESFAPYTDDTGASTIDAKDEKIPAYVRKNAYSYLSAEEISKLTKSLDNIAKKQPRQTDATGTMEEPTAEDKANALKNIQASRDTTESEDFDDFYFTELMPWTNKAKEEKHLKLADKYSNKEKAAKAILDAEGGKVSAVRVYKMKSGGKVYLLTMVNKDGRDMYYIAANTSGLKSVQKATQRSLQSVISDNHGSLGKEFSSGGTGAGKNKQTFSATIPKMNTQSLNSDEAIAKNLKLGTNWKRYIVPVSDEKYGDGKQYGTKQSGYVYVFPSTDNGIVVVTDSADKLKMVVRNEDLTKYNTQDGNVITKKDKVIIKPTDAAPTQPVEPNTPVEPTDEPVEPTETPAESPNTSAAPEPSTTPKPATEEPPTAFADTQAPTMNVANDVPKEDGVPVEEIDWTKYDYLIGNSPDGNGMAVLVDTDAITTLEGARKQSATGAKFFADAVIGNKKRKDYAENTVTLGDKLFYKFEGNFDSLGTGDASDPIELLRGMGYSHEDIEYPLPSGKSARITGFYKVKKQEETFAEYRERMLNELNEKK